MIYSLSSPAVLFDCQAYSVANDGSRLLEVGWRCLLNPLDIDHSKIDDSWLVETRLIKQSCSEPLPNRVTALTGITSDILQDAHAPEVVAASLARALNDLTTHVLLAHYASFERRHLSEFLSRHGYAVEAERVRSDLLCLCETARAVWKGLPSYSLEALAGWCDLPVIGKKRVATHLNATSVLYVRLLHSLRELGFHSFPSREELRVIQSTSPVTKVTSHISSERFRELPQAPGLYFFYNGSNQLLYIGKSNCIRTRVRSHFPKKSVQVTHDKLLRLHARRVEFYEMETALEAALLEPDYIKSEQPLFNVAFIATTPVWWVHRAPPYGYTCFIRNEDAHGEDVGLYFGPFSSRGGAENVSRTFRLLAGDTTMLLELLGSPIDENTTRRLLDPVVEWFFRTAPSTEESVLNLETIVSRYELLVQSIPYHVENAAALEQEAPWYETGSMLFKLCVRLHRCRLLLTLAQSIVAWEITPGHSRVLRIESGMSMSAQDFLGSPSDGSLSFSAPSINSEQAHVKEFTRLHYDRVSVLLTHLQQFSSSRVSFSVRMPNGTAVHELFLTASPPPENPELIDQKLMDQKGAATSTL